MKILFDINIRNNIHTRTMINTFSFQLPFLKKKASNTTASVINPAVENVVKMVNAKSATKNLFIFSSVNSTKIKANNKYI